MVTAERTTTPVAAYEFARSYSTITRSCHRLLRQYMYCCSRKQVKRGILELGEVALDYPAVLQELRQYLCFCTTFCVSMCAFVLVKQVK